jgi:UDP-N-acetyl-D-mannosaminuronic acid dehydrogenase
MKVCFLGLGYIGLPTAIVAASAGYKVHGVDVKEKLIFDLNNGILPIEESGLERLFLDYRQNLSFSMQAVEAEVYVVAVPTPFTVNMLPDVSYVISACKAVFEVIQEGGLLIIESTSPVGTTSMVEEIWKSCPRSKDVNINFAYCPERVIPGNLIQELKINDRIIGANSDVGANLAMSFYSGFVEGKLLRTNWQTAEMCKLVENSYRDVNIAFANELASLSEKFEVDVYELIKLANHHPRVNILKPGIGVGGHCLAVDPYFLVSSAPDEAKLISLSREINRSRPKVISERILDLTEVNSVKSIALCGFTYKPDIDDYRESPAVEIIENIISRRKDLRITVFDPHVKVKIFDNQFLDLPDPDKFDLVIILVDHSAFGRLKSGKTTNIISMVS